MIIVVWFSCGAASAVAAKLTVDKYGSNHNVIIVNNPVDEEDSDNIRFMNDVSKWIDRPIIQAVNSKLGHSSAVNVWDDGNFMSNRFGAQCTISLKKEARYQFEREHEIDYHVLGFVKEEQSRHDRFIMSERSNTLPILIDSGITKPMCFDMITDAGLKLPRVYLQGYPNANCIGCVKATSPTYWNHVRKQHPIVFEQRAEQSRRIGAKLTRYKGERMYLDELPVYAKGAKMKSYDCGIFCDQI